MTNPRFQYWTSHRRDRAKIRHQQAKKNDIFSGKCCFSKENDGIVHLHVKVILNQDIRPPDLM